MGTLKRIMYVLFFAVGFVLFMSYKMTSDQIFYTRNMVTTVAPLSAKSAMRGFQDENDMTLYTDISGSGMSSNYDHYLNWLGGYGDYNEVVNELRAGFTEGKNPTNYALPYLDINLLEESFNQLFEQQLNEINDVARLASIVSARGEVIGMDREMHNFGTSATMWGLGSNFYTNTAGHTMYYDYNNYITYMVDYRVTVEMEVRYPVFNIILPLHTMVFDFSIPYELVN